MRTTRLTRSEIDEPAPIAVGSYCQRLITKRNAYGLARLRGPPDRNGNALLENRVVPEQGVRNNVRVAGPGKKTDQA